MLSQQQGQTYEVISAQSYSPLYIEHLIMRFSNGTSRRVLVFKNYFDFNMKPLLILPGDILSYSCY